MTERFRASIAERGVRAVLIAGAVVVSVLLVRRSIPMYLPRDWDNAHELDAIVDWKAARLYFLGVSPYSAQGLAAVGVPAMGHPPTTPFWYLPLAEFPKSVAVQLSTFLVWFLLPIHTFLCASALELPVPLVTALLVASGLFAAPFVVHHCDATQLSEPIAVLYVLGWWFLRTRRDARGGTCLGLALTMKLFPGVLLLMLLVAKRFRALFAATAAYLAIAALMTQTFGVHAWLEFFHQQGGVADEWLGSVYNSSLAGLVMQLITPVCVPQGHPSKLATAVTLAGSFVLLGLAMWSSKNHLRQARAFDPRAIDLPFALFALLSVFLNAWVWDHYAVLVVQPLFILSAAFWRSWRAAFRAWCDERRSNASLFKAGVALLVGAAGLFVAVRASLVDAHQTAEIQRLWSVVQLPFYHHALHVLQIANFATWLVPIALCFLALHLSRRGLDSDRGLG